MCFMALGDESTVNSYSERFHRKAECRPVRRNKNPNRFSRRGHRVIITVTPRHKPSVRQWSDLFSKPSDKPPDDRPNEHTIPDSSAVRCH